ncbi:hypothetical protein SDC9_187797 [bioreactor metagenome]|uniref:Uncharacterized protein n=1 Tax=bioreactor metagenome TaxID=1076179 RepID=A0A645HMH6_9ZZZZ
MPIHQLSVHDNTATHTCTQCDYDKIFHSAGCTIGHLSNSCSIGIVGECYGNTHPVFQQLGKRDYSFPGKVGCKLDTSGKIITVGGTCTDSFDLIFGGCSRDKIFNQVSQFIQIIFYLSVFGCFDTATL